MRVLFLTVNSFSYTNLVLMLYSLCASNIGENGSYFFVFVVGSHEIGNVKNFNSQSDAGHYGNFITRPMKNSEEGKKRAASS